jgi:YfiH family protein
MTEDAMRETAVESAPPHLTLDALDAQACVRHAFFTRLGGVSDGIYESLNCGPGSQDQSVNVAENRERALTALDLPDADLATLYQAHTAEAVTVEQPWPMGQGPRADAMVTRQQGVALGILTADCAPVLMADAAAGVIGAAHAGWRGALGGILSACIDAMEDLGADRESIVAGIGPCIGPASYEVGPEFPTPFLEQAADNRDFFSPAPRDGHHLFDLPGFIERRLARLRVGGVETLPIDTRADPARFFSARRARINGESDYGRLLSTIVLTR